MLARWGFILVAFFSPLTAPAASICQKVYSKPLSESESIHSTLQNLKNFSTRYGVPYDPDQTLYHGGTPPQPPGQEELLENGFSHSSTKPSAQGVEEWIGFETKGAHSNPKRRTIRTSPVLTNSITQNQELLGEIWQTSDGQRFRIMNAGSSLLANDGAASLFHDQAVRVAQQYPGEDLNIQVPFNPQWAKAREVILDRQNLASSRVTDHYRDTKPYLNQEVLFDLRDYDHSVPNRNDYFMLLADRGHSPLTLGPGEFYQDLKAVVRLSRFESATLEEKFMIFKGIGFMDSLPHESRTWLRLKKQLRNFFTQLAMKGKIHITEITRFNRFAPVPREAMEGLMLKALETALDPQRRTDLFILSCDEGLVDYYRDRYGFEILTQIDAPSSEGHAEYVMFLDTRTKSFRDTLTRLRQGSQGIRRQRDSNPPPITEWTSGWGLPQNHFANSPFERKKIAIQQMEDWTESVKSSLTKTPPNNQLGVSSKRPISNKQADKILKEAEAQGLQNIFEKLNHTLTSEDISRRHELMDVFGDEGSKILINASTHAGANDRMLIAGPEASTLRRFLLEKFGNRVVQASWPHEKESLDQVILFYQLAQRSPAEVKTWLEKSFYYLKHGQQLTVVEKFKEDRYQNSQPDLSPLEEARSRVLLAIEKGLPLTESQIVTAFAIEWKIQSSLRRYSVSEFLKLAEQAGFIVDSYTGVNDSHQRSWALTLTRP